ncbi:DUF3576 domain-containing protein [Amylibacter sp.]|nr:DUF3576 domain-containing protein [Amylibacter sp.]MDB2600884.1 DUF3576 domain-containing protein [Amylibacter sp.]
MNYLFKFTSLLLLCAILQACSTTEKNDITEADVEKVTSTTTDQVKKKGIVLIDDNGKLGDLFKSGGDEIGSVNKYLWQASIEVLNFLPINSADPFSGIIVFGKGKAPGSSQSYDATVYISDPALDARSLSVTVRSSNGIISLAAKREIESAILSRARQLRLKELDL